MTLTKKAAVTVRIAASRTRARGEARSFRDGDECQQTAPRSLAPMANRAARLTI